MSLGGVTSQQSDSFSQLGLALLAAILIVYVVFSDAVAFDAVCFMMAAKQTKPMAPRSMARMTSAALAPSSGRIRSS